MPKKVNSAKKVSLREKLRSAKKLKRVPVKAFGETLYIRQLSWGDLENVSEWEADSNFRKGTKALMHALEYEDGTRVFVPEEDLDLINSQPQDVIMQLVEEMNRLNGFDLAALEKNSESVQSDVSYSA